MRSPSFVDLGSEKGDEYEDHSIRREDMDGSVQNLATEEFDAQSTLPRYNFYSQSNRSDHNSTVFSKKDRSYLEKILLDDSFANSRIGLFLPPIRKGQPNDGLSLKKLPQVLLRSIDPGHSQKTEDNISYTTYRRSTILRQR